VGSIFSGSIKIGEGVRRLRTGFTLETVPAVRQGH
jgi:hypothetical protein